MTIKMKIIFKLSASSNQYMYVYNTDFICIYSFVYTKSSLVNTLFNLWNFHVVLINGPAVVKSTFRRLWLNFALFPIFSWRFYFPPLQCLVAWFWVLLHIDSDTFPRILDSALYSFEHLDYRDRVQKLCR